MLGGGGGLAHQRGDEGISLTRIRRDRKRHQLPLARRLQGCAQPM